MLTLKFHPSDLKKLIPRKEDLHLFELFDINETIKALSTVGPTYSVFDDNRNLVTIIGVRPFYPNMTGVGEVWQFPCEGMIKKNLAGVLRVFWGLENAMRPLGYWRLFTLCPDDHLHNRWMQYLGFKKEGILKAHGCRGEDQVVYGKVC